MLQGIELALEEDGPDLTSNALFAPQDTLQASIVAKEAAVLCGMPLVPLILQRIDEAQSFLISTSKMDGDRVHPGEEIIRLDGSARTLLKAERVILNFLSHLSGVATLTNAFVARMDGHGSRLLDTRKTLPGLRYPEKYAVRIGGGENHRIDLTEMLMLKDNHIDRAGTITAAVQTLRNRHTPCPPIEVECRTLEEVDEAAACGVHRIMLDNMSADDITAALRRIPSQTESEISGGVSLDNISELASLGADYISVGCITNSARAIDLSMSLAQTV